MASERRMIPRASRAPLVSRPRSPVNTGGGDAPGAQGARRAHTGSMQPTSNPPSPGYGETSPKPVAVKPGRRRAPPAGMHRPSNAAGVSPRAARPAAVPPRQQKASDVRNCAARLRSAQWGPEPGRLIKHRILHRRHVRCETTLIMRAENCPTVFQRFTECHRMDTCRR